MLKRIFPCQLYALIITLMLALAKTSALSAFPNETFLLEMAEFRPSMHSRPHHAYDAHQQTPDMISEELTARTFLDALEPTVSKECNRAVIANWNFATNITDTAEEKLLLDGGGESSHAKEDHDGELEGILPDVCVKVLRSLRTESTNRTSSFNRRLFQAMRVVFGPHGPFAGWRKYSDRVLRRRISKMTESLDAAILEGADLGRFLEVVGSMKTIYSTATVCLQDDEECEHPLDADTMIRTTAKSKDSILLLRIWKAWREASGKKIRDLFIGSVKLLNKAAKMNGYKDAAEMWTSKYETTNFPQKLENLWKQVEPLYKKLHAYVRMRLRKTYGSSIVQPTEPIPAHILGNPWAQSWINIADLVAIPCLNSDSPNITKALTDQGYDVMKMFRTADEFFQSMGLLPLTDTFWKKSVFVKPVNRRIICHASAWDFCLGPESDDFRVKMCAQVSVDDFVVIHHELGHVQYYMLYKHQPKIFRQGANPGFHEGVGDTIALSVSSPENLRKMGFMPTGKELADCEDLNHLLNIALRKIAALPWAYLIDLWRWDIFKGTVPFHKMNSHWWKLREGIQGVKAPAARDEDDFDAGSKYHIAAVVPYDRYFVSLIVQFQFYEALCKAAGQYDAIDSGRPLHRCNFYQSKEAGDTFRKGLSLGSSRPWPEVMEAITGQHDMSAAALLQYFQPLEKYLDRVLRENGECIGWRGL